MEFIAAKLKQKKELNNNNIDSLLKKAIHYFFESVNVNKECNLNYKIEKVEGVHVHVIFTWIADGENYDSSCNTWDPVIQKLHTKYNFSKDKEILLEEILTELEDNVIVNF